VQPIIGIVSQTLEDFMKNDTRFDNYNTYIMGTFVDFMKSAGARIIPLVRGEPEEVTLDKLSKINGVLFPGGDGDYIEYAHFIYNQVKRINDEGTYLPLWGTCMGYEQIVAYAASEGQPVLEKYVLYTTPLPLKFVKDPRDT
jgi:gamma-glutamyl hydrolase